jgi:hypothetical protein
LVGARYGCRHDDGICHRSLSFPAAFGHRIRGGGASSQSAAPTSCRNGRLAADRHAASDSLVFRV